MTKSEFISKIGLEITPQGAKNLWDKMSVYTYDFIANREIKINDDAIENHDLNSYEILYIDNV